jgi:hypothetical protein
MTNLTLSSFFMFISVLYMFRATSCSSSGESIVSVQHLVCIALCRWPSSMQVGSTCFEQPRAHHQENQLYQYNIWYVSLCVGDRLVCRSALHVSSNLVLIIRRINCISTTSGMGHSDRLVCRSGRNPTCTLDGHLHRVSYTRCSIDTIESPDDEHGVGRNM